MAGSVKPIDFPGTQAEWEANQKKLRGLGIIDAQGERPDSLDNVNEDAIDRGNPLNDPRIVSVEQGSEGAPYLDIDRDTHEGAGKDTYLFNISEDNQLFKYASYNTLFTLSALSQAELESPKTILNSKLHDIIVRSAGIGPGDTTNKGKLDPYGSGYGGGEWGGKGREGGGLSKENQEIIAKHERMRKTHEKSQQEFRKNNDMYFRNVEMNSVPGYNEERRLTTVAKISMDIVEPWGITLLERVKAAAANNNYLDHLDAPYLLTIDFAGWDEKGQPIKDGKNLKRMIPIKLLQMDIDISQGGTVYSITAIPYSEFAYVDRYNTVRTAGTIIPKDKTFSSIVQELEKILNKQTKDETDDGINEIPDVYKVSIDQAFNPDTTFVVQKYLQQLPMRKQSYDTSAGYGEGKLDPALFKAANVDTSMGNHEYMKIAAGDSIVKILEDIMKTHPDVNQDKYDEWNSRVRKKIGKWGKDVQAVYDEARGMFFTSYKIRSTVIPQARFDEKRKTHVKLIKYVIEPYLIHAYNLAISGVSTGQNFKHFVHKTYNYIFTGENVDILDVRIQYKVAYYSAQIKKVEDAKKNKSGEPDVVIDGHSTARDKPEDYTYLLRSEAGLAQSGGTGRTGESTTALDQFMDYLTHPKGDMIVVRMEILGDPAWISQSQFMPADPMWIAPGTSKDDSISAFRANKDWIWNDDLKCYNAEFAEPIILLNYRMPTDINDKLGTYELQDTQSVSFSGLYKVFQIDHSFNEGKYINTLHMARFNNQGVSISKPYTEYKRYTVNGETIIGSKADVTGMYTDDPSGLSGFDDIFANIKSKVEKVKKGIGAEKPDIIKNIGVDNIKAMIAKAKKKLKT